MSILPVIVPSWVIPGSPAVNAAFLRGRAQGIMLCSFEHAPLLPVELPASSFDLCWHIHLPVDLPWKQDGATAGAAACRIMAGAAHLLCASSRVILHQPPQPSFLTGFLRVWNEAGLDNSTLLLENLPDLTPDSAKKSAEKIISASHGLRLCLDVAHLALSRSPALTEQAVEALARQTDMIHWSAPGSTGKDAHAPLTALDASLRKLYGYIAKSMPDALDVIEVFDWEGVSASWDLLRSWRRGGTK